MFLYTIRESRVSLCTQGMILGNKPKFVPNLHSFMYLCAQLGGKGIQNQSYYPAVNLQDGSSMMYCTKVIWNLNHGDRKSVV